MSRGPELNPRGSLKKPRSRKPRKWCEECGRTFTTRDRYALHVLAHDASQHTRLTLHEAEAELASMRANGELVRQRGGFSVRERSEDRA